MTGADRHRERRNRLRELIADQAGVPFLIVTSLPNVRYLSGFTGSNAVLAVGPDADHDLIGTDGRYVDQVAQEAPDLATVIDRGTLGAVLNRLPPAPLGIEASLTVADAAAVRAVHGEPVMTDGLVEGLRMVKDADELAALRRACRITAEAMGLLMAEMRPGVPEVRLARRLEQLFGDLGAEDRAFDTIVGSGPNSAIPHHQPGRRALEPGDLVVVDAGARIDGYHADMTRTFVVAAEPADWQVQIHAAVQDAQATATRAYLPGSDRRSIDTAARAVVERAGLGKRFTHGLGHGVGLEIHEAPMIGERATGTIAADMAITVEPGVYLPGRGGVRIEDTLVVTDAGPQILTEAPRGLLAVG